MKSLDAITNSTLAEIRALWRDVEWEQQQGYVVLTFTSADCIDNEFNDNVCRAYHVASMLSLNNILRRYNIIAPYHVRRSPLSLAFELKLCIRDSAPIIEEELRKRMMGIVLKKQEQLLIPVVQDNFWSALKRLFRNP
jgi:hypothetical protein